MEKLKGVITALPTPFNEYGSLKLETTARHVDDSIAAGVSGFWVNGATGCCIFLSMDQRKKMLETVCEAVAGRVKVYAMVSAMNTADGVELARHAAGLHVGGVSAFPPLLYPTGCDSIIAYLKDLKEAAGLPMIYYHVPGLTKVALESSDLIRICKEAPLAAMKFCDTDIFKAIEMKNECPDISILTGLEEIMLGGMAMKCFDGTVGASQNFIPGPYVDLFNAFEAGDLAEAQRIEAGITRVVSVQGMLFDFTATTYTMMNLLGYDYGQPVAPMPKLNAEQIDQCRKALLKVVKPDPLEEGRLIETKDLLFCG